MAYLEYKGKHLYSTNEIKEYLSHVTKAPNKAIDNFFNYLGKKLNSLDVKDLHDLYFNYLQYSTMMKSPADFLIDIFGHYHLGNGNLLMRVLQSIENQDSQYFEFKEATIRKNIVISEENYNYYKDQNNKLEKGTEEYKRNLKLEIRWLENKRNYMEELNEFLKARK